MEQAIQQERGGYCRGVAFGALYELVRQEQTARLIERDLDGLTTEDLLVGLDRADLREVAGEVSRADALASVYERR